MVGMIFLVWFLMVLAFPVLFIALSYIRFGRETALVAILGRLLAVFAVYAATTFVMFYPMFAIIYVGANSQLGGNAFDLTGRLILRSLVFGYGG
jgi:hypothetical protein